LGLLYPNCCTDWDEIWRGGGSLLQPPDFTPIGATCRPCRVKNLKIGLLSKLNTGRLRFAQCSKNSGLCSYVDMGIAATERQHTATFHIKQFTHCYALTFGIFHSAFYLTHYAIPHFTNNDIVVLYCLITSNYNQFVFRHLQTISRS